MIDWPLLRSRAEWHRFLKDTSVICIFLKETYIYTVSTNNINYFVRNRQGKEQTAKTKKPIHNIFASVEFSRRKIGIFRGEYYVINTSKLSF